MGSTIHRPTHLRFGWVPYIILGCGEVWFGNLWDGFGTMRYPRWRWVKPRVSHKDIKRDVFLLYLVRMVISIDETSNSCEIIGGSRDWQVLWNDLDTRQSLIGMTEKMHDQLSWAYRYMTRFRPESRGGGVPFNFDCYHRSSRDQILLYTLIRRRLNDVLTDPCFYTLEIPRPVPPLTKHEVDTQDLTIKLTRKPRKRHIRFEIFYRECVWLIYTSSLWGEGKLSLVNFRGKQFVCILLVHIKRFRSVCGVLERIDDEIKDVFVVV